MHLFPGPTELVIVIAADRMALPLCLCSGRTCPLVALTNPSKHSATAKLAAHAKGVESADFVKQLRPQPCRGLRLTTVRFCIILAHKHTEKEKDSGKASVLLAHQHLHHGHRWALADLCMKFRTRKQVSSLGLPWRSPTKHTMAHVLNPTPRVVPNLANFNSSVFNYNYGGKCCET